MQPRTTIHAPRTWRDGTVTDRSTHPLDSNPRATHVARPRGPSSKPGPSDSNPRATHVARRPGPTSGAARRNSNPRATHVARLFQLIKYSFYLAFQPTRHARGATSRWTRVGTSTAIPTHAPRTWRDIALTYGTIWSRVFQPTRHARGATAGRSEQLVHDLAHSNPRAMHVARPGTINSSIRPPSNSNPRATHVARPRWTVYSPAPPRNSNPRATHVARPIILPIL